MKFHIKSYTVSRENLEAKFNTKDLNSLKDTQQFRSALLSLDSHIISNVENDNNIDDSPLIKVHIVEVELSGQKYEQIAMFFEQENDKNLIGFYPIFNFKELLKTNEENPNQLQLFVRACDDTFLIELINRFSAIFSKNIYNHASGLFFVHCLILERKTATLFHAIEQYPNLNFINQLTGSGLSPLLLAIQNQLAAETVLLANLKKCDLTVRIPNTHANKRFHNLDAIGLAFECFPEALDILLSATPKTITGASYFESPKKRFLFGDRDPKHPIRRALQLYRNDRLPLRLIMKNFPDFDLLLFLRSCEEELLIDILTHHSELILNLKHDNNDYGTCYFTHGLIIENKRHVFEFLLKFSPESLDIKTSNGFSPLHLAIIHGRHEIATWITQQPVCDYNMLSFTTSTTHANAEFRNKNALDLAFDKFPAGIDILLSTKKYNFANDSSHPLTRAVQLYKKNPEPLSYVVFHYDISVWKRDLLHRLFELRKDGFALKQSLFQLARKIVGNSTVSSEESQTHLSNLFLVLFQQNIEESLELCSFLLEVAKYFMQLGANFGKFSQRQAFIKKLSAKTLQEIRFKDEIGKICNTILVLLVQEYLLDLKPNLDNTEINLVKTVKEHLLKLDSNKISSEKLDAMKALRNWIKENKYIVPTGWFSSAVNPLFVPLEAAIEELENYQNKFKATTCRFDLKSGNLLLSFPLDEEGDIILWLKDIFKHTNIFAKPKQLASNNSNNNNQKAPKKFRNADLTRGIDRFTIRIPTDNISLEKIIETLKTQQIINEGQEKSAINESKKDPEFYYDVYAYLLARMWSQKTGKIKWETIRSVLEKAPEEVDPGYKPLPLGITLEDLQIKLANERYNSREQTLLHLAARDNQADMVLKLLSIDLKTASLRDEGDNLPIHTLISRDSTEALEAYLAVIPEYLPSLKKDGQNRISQWDQPNSQGKTALQMAMDNYEHGKPDALRLYIYHTGRIPSNFMEKTYLLDQKLNKLADEYSDSSEERAEIEKKKEKMRNYAKKASKLIRSMLDDKKTSVFHEHTQNYINRILTELCLQKFSIVEEENEFQQLKPVLSKERSKAPPSALLLQAFEDTLLLIRDYIRCGAMFAHKLHKKPPFPFEQLFINNPFYILGQLKLASSKNKANTDSDINDTIKNAKTDFVQMVKLFSAIREAYLTTSVEVTAMNKILNILHQNKWTFKTDAAQDSFDILCECLEMGSYVKIKESGIYWEKDVSSRTLILDIALKEKNLNNNEINVNVIEKSILPKWLEEAFQKTSSFELALQENNFKEDMTKIFTVILNNHTAKITPVQNEFSSKVKLTLEPDDNADVWADILARLAAHKVINETQKQDLSQNLNFSNINLET